ncbi:MULTISPECIES: hypothetical protein [Nocardioides]|uniref:Integral membrane protein n=1 Tax=Nocardioides vastitatis TaxID=2568655 RepID=A0ABW0ZKX3_9ACTN|nr:hypothetical protein [Nocardioides sp.]THJ06218.1 hypothetical protein E7Z54_06270 [Nocardioides sp.]
MADLPMHVSDAPAAGFAERSRSLRPLGAALLVLSAALVVNTLAGPLVIGWIDYPITESMLNQLLGLELVTVLLVVPVAVTAGVFAIRERPLAPLLAIGPSAYTAYMFAQYVVGPLYDRYSATVLFQLAIASVSGIVTVWCWVRAAEVRLPAVGRRRRRNGTAWLVFLAVFVLLRYSTTVTGALSGDRIPEEFGDSPAFYWSIFLLDLGVVVPVTLLAAGALYSRRRLGQHAYYALIGWFTMVPPSVAAMAAVMVARDDPHASVPTLILTASASVLFAIPAIAAVRQLSRKEGVTP